MHTPGEALNASRLLTGPAGITGRFNEMRSRLQRCPIDTWSDDETGYRGLTRYAVRLHAARRPVAGHLVRTDHLFLCRARLCGRPGVLRRRLVRLDSRPAVHGRPPERQRVPIVFVRDEFEPTFRKYFPLVARPMSTVNYVKAEPAANASRWLVIRCGSRNHVRRFAFTSASDSPASIIVSHES